MSAQDIAGFKDRFYSGPNMLAVVIVPANRAEAARYVKKRAQNIPVRRKVSCKPAKFKPGLKTKTEKTNFSQAHLALGFPCPSYKSSLLERITAALLHTIMGANMSSRLFESLRESQGLVYEVSTAVKMHFDTGAFIIHCGLDSSNIFKALKIIFKEINRIKSFNAGRKEFKRAKEYFWGNFLMRLENPSDMMFYVADSLVHLGRVYPPAVISRALEKVDIGYLRRFSLKVFNLSALKVSLVSPQAIEKAELEKFVKRWQN